MSSRKVSIPRTTIAHNTLTLRPGSVSPCSVAPQRSASVSSSIPQPPAPRMKKPRASRPKVRTGCITCKIRRVKCDEGKPSCKKCSSTGRTCDGYDAPKLKTVSIFPNPTRNHGTTEEHIFLSFFQKRTAPALSSYFEEDFWGHIVLQIGYDEPAIRHAMVAVGTLHQKRELAISPPNLRGGADHNDPFALKQYSQAMNCLGVRMSEHKHSLDVALISCLLFVCLEFLRGDWESANAHLQSGLAILGTWPHTDHSQLAATTIRTVERNLAPFFNRLEILYTLSGHMSPYPYPIESTYVVPEYFASLKDARDSVVHLMNLGLRTIRQATPLRYTGNHSPELLATRDHILKELDRFSSVLDHYLVVSASTHPEWDLRAAHMLMIHKHVAFIWISICIHASECASDDFFSTYAEINELAQSVLDFTGDTPRTGSLPSFLFDMEVVPPLYYVGGTCREPKIRRKAQALLRSTTRREGLWDSLMCAAVIERVMAIEEAGLGSQTGIALPPEVARLHNTRIDSDPGLNPSHHQIMLQRKPNGLDGEFDWWLEDIYL